MGPERNMKKKKDNAVPLICIRNRFTIKTFDLYGNSMNINQSMREEQKKKTPEKNSQLNRLISIIDTATLESIAKSNTELTPGGKRAWEGVGGKAGKAGRNLRIDWCKQSIEGDRGRSIDAQGDTRGGGSGGGGEKKKM